MDMEDPHNYVVQNSFSNNAMIGENILNMDSEIKFRAMHCPNPNPNSVLSHSGVKMVIIYHMEDPHNSVM